MAPLGQPTSRKYSRVPAPLSWDVKPAVCGGGGEGSLTLLGQYWEAGSLADRVNTLFKVLKLLPAAEQQSWQPCSTMSGPARRQGRTLELSGG